VSQLREKFVGLKAKIDRRVKHIGTPRGDVSRDLIEYIGAAGCERRSKIIDTIGRPAHPNCAKIGEPVVERAVEVRAGRVLRAQGYEVVERAGGEALKPWVGRGEDAFDRLVTGTVKSQIFIGIS
jgi:hypothetical protein